MNHFEHCFCERRCGDHPPLPAPQPGGFLMQQIVGTGRSVLRYERFTLCLSDLPACDQAPLRLIDVRAREDNIHYEYGQGGCGCNTMTVCTHIPLCCTLCDGCNQRYGSASGIDVPVQVRLCASEREFERSRLVLSAAVRLARALDCVQGNTVSACLDVCVEIWAVTCRPLYSMPCEAACPPALPLYPQMRCR